MQLHELTCSGDVGGPHLPYVELEKHPLTGLGDKARLMKATWAHQHYMPTRIWPALPRGDGNSRNPAGRTSPGGLPPTVTNAF